LNPSTHLLPENKKDDITGKWRRIHNKELYDLGHTASMWKRPTAYRVLVTT
jgi:hypothetical protein